MNETTSVARVVNEIVLETWLENASSDVWRIVSGVATILELDRDELVKYMPKFLPLSLLRDRPRRQDVALAIEDAIEHILETFADHEAWDSYHASRSPSAYKFAAAVATWMYLLAHHYGSNISVDCPLFSEKIKATVAEFLTTKVARPVSETVARLRDVGRCYTAYSTYV